MCTRGWRTIFVESATSIETILQTARGKMRQSRSHEETINETAWTRAVGVREFTRYVE